MKKKKSSKSNQENPNQLSFEFLFREPSIDVHIPRTNVKNFDTRLATPKRLTIKLAPN
jgi:hypothetical protein